MKLIGAMENLIPDCRAGSSESKSYPSLPHAEISPAVGIGRKQEKAIDPPASPSAAREVDEHSHCLK